MRGEPLRAAPKPASRAKPPRGPHSTLRQRTPIKARPKAERKPRIKTREIVPDFIRFIQAQPCCITKRHQCGHVEAAHLDGVGIGGSDYTAVPLCGTLHRDAKGSLHKQGPRSFDLLWGTDLRAINAALVRRYWMEVAG